LNFKHFGLSIFCRNLTLSVALSQTDWVSLSQIIISLTVCCG
jgi:hypothetical protein